MSDIREHKFVYYSPNPYHHPYHPKERISRGKLKLEVMKSKTRRWMYRWRNGCPDLIIKRFCELNDGDIK
jgi:hypothetical protein